MTYVVLVILIALWAMVLLPPYLKDRRSSGRTFRSMQPGTVNSAQRFLPLQRASGGYAAPVTGAGVHPTGVSRLGANVGANIGANIGAHGASGISTNSRIAAAVTGPASVQSRSDDMSSNVVQLRPVDTQTPDSGRSPLATSAAAYLEDAPATDESALHEAWDTPQSAGVGMPGSTAAARERRRQVLLGLTGVALVTLLFALFAGGRWVAIHVLVDVVMLGYVILLVRHRQMMADRMMKVEPIRPPVNEQMPSSVQLAPAYLLRSKTGS